MLVIVCFADTNRMLQLDRKNSYEYSPDECTKVRWCLGTYLSKSHYDVELTEDQLRRITLWLDSNSLEMPSFSLAGEVQQKARRGELVWPALDVDPENPLRALSETASRSSVLGNLELSFHCGHGPFWGSQVISTPWGAKNKPTQLIHLRTYHRTLIL